MTAPPRPRLDPRARDRGRVPPTRAAAAEVIITRVEAPTCAILAVVDLSAGRLSRADRELMAAARHLADALGGQVVMLAGPSPAARPEIEGADSVIQPIHEAFRQELAESRLPFVLAAAATCATLHMLFPETALGGELARRVAARLGDRPATRIRRLSATEVMCGADGGRSEVTRPLPRVLVPAPGAFAPLPPGSLRAATPIAMACEPEPARAEVIETAPPDPGLTPLAEADLIISGGGGVSDWDSFHAVAAALGAAEAGSRVACDAGLLPRHRQVGVSGALVAPRCYLAFGIAGASQHLQGIEAAERVIAVNADPHADMLKRADLAIVADAQDVLPALVARGRARGMRHV